MSKGKKWTVEEENLLIENIGRVPKEHILEMFPDRTWKAITHKYKKLGFKFKDNYDPIPEDERFKIINDVNHMKCKSCRRYLPLDFLYFPRDSKCKIGFRNVCKECKGENFRIHLVWNEDEEKIIKEVYETMTNREIQKQLFPDKTIEQISHKGSHMGLYKNEETFARARAESYTDEWRNKISQTHIAKGYAKGKNNPMYGSSRKGKDNPNWNGGISQLYAHLRRNIKEWKIESMKSSNYKCVLTGDIFDDIHHTYAFKNIINDTLHNLNLPIKEFISEYTEEELLKIETECLRIHMKYLGVCLRKDIHELFHSLYGYGDNTIEQFEEFSFRYNIGEFDDILSSIS